MDRRFVLLSVLSSAALVVAAPARAQVAEACAELEGPPPEGYDEQTQLDFLANRAALSTTLSPLHAPIPHEAGRGSIGLEVGVVPPAGCERRFVAQHTQTWDTQGPVLLRPRATFAFPALGPVIPYAGLAYVPPVAIGGATWVVVSAELGVGLPVGEALQLGARVHATQAKRVAEIATPATDGDPVFEDMLVASTLGADLMLGVVAGPVVPYLAGGLTDASTSLYVGDQDQILNTLHPYLGPAISLGADALLADRLRLGAEAYAAPGGYSLPDPEAPTNSAATAYGSLYTARLKVAVEL